MRPPRTVGTTILDVLMIWIMIAVAAAAFWPVYRATPYLVAVAGAVIAGTLVALLGARFRWPSFAVLLVSVAVFLAGGCSARRSGPRDRRGAAVVGRHPRPGRRRRVRLEAAADHHPAGRRLPGAARARVPAVLRDRPSSRSRSPCAPGSANSPSSRRSWRSSSRSPSAPTRRPGRSRSPSRCSSRFSRSWSGTAGAAAAKPSAPWPGPPPTHRGARSRRREMPPSASARSSPGDSSSRWRRLPRSGRRPSLP